MEVRYEIPYEAVLETIVNACIHRSYTNNGSVQVELYPDRLEVSNPGGLPYGFTIDKLTTLHNSQPTNPILAQPVYLAGYIERIGTGTTDIVEKCLGAGLKAPEFRQDSYGMTVTIWRKGEQWNEPQTSAVEGRFGENEPQNDPQNVIGKRARKLLELMMSNPQISKETLASELGISEVAVRRIIRALRGS